MISAAEQNQIDLRNRLRRSADLPLLGGPTEARRLAAVKANADFEAAFATYRDQVAHEWAGNADGFFANLSRYSAARKRFQAWRSLK